MYLQVLQFFHFFSGRASALKIYLCGMTRWNSPELFTGTFLTRHFYMILNQHSISNKLVNNTPIFWKKYFLVTGAYDPKWPPSSILYGGQMTTDQLTNMSPTLFWSPDDVFTGFEVQQNPLKSAHSTYTSSKSIRCSNRTLDAAR